MKLSASEGKLDKLRRDGIHAERDGTGKITHSVIFEITRAHDLFANSGGTAQKTLRCEALRVALERATSAQCYLSIFVLGICASFKFLERDWRLALGPYDIGVEATNQIFGAVSHAALEALADQWKTRNVARYLAQSQATRLLSSGSVQEGDTVARLRRRNEAGDAADVREGYRTSTRYRGTVGALEDSDVMPGEVSSDRPPERRRKVKKSLRDSMLPLGLVKLLKAFCSRGSSSD